MEGPELLAAKQLGDIDLVIAHHPEGLGLAGLSEVMDLQADVLANYGVPINIAESVISRELAKSAVVFLRSIMIEQSIWPNYWD